MSKARRLALAAYSPAVRPAGPPPTINTSQTLSVISLFLYYANQSNCCIDSTKNCRSITEDGHQHAPTVQAQVEDEIAEAMGPVEKGERDHREQVDPDDGVGQERVEATSAGAVGHPSQGNG